MIIYRILLITLLITCIYSSLIYTLYNEPEEQKKEQQEKTEEREKAYLTLENMTTHEILLFKKKDDFIKDVGCYDILRNFYNDDEIIKKIYPGYKKL